MNTLLSFMNSRLNAVLFGPPCPLPKSWELSKTAPPPEPWDPPGCTKVDDGFELLPGIVCFQRGRYAQSVFDAYVEIDADRFKHTVEYVRNCIQGMPFDFLVVAIDEGTVVAGCMLEFRCVKSGDRPSYVYLSSLCTKASHGRQGIAHRMVEGVKTLGAILVREKPPGYPIIDNSLHIGLCVRRIPAKHGGLVDDARLIGLYSQCGFERRTRETPTFGYRSFTRHSIYNWDLDHDPTEMTTMWCKITNSQSALGETDRPPASASRSPPPAAAAPPAQTGKDVPRQKR